MENINKTPVDEVREEYFDQTVGALEDLEAAQERKPDNEKIKTQIKKVKEILDMILSEMDNDYAPPKNAREIGSYSLSASEMAAEQSRQKPAKRTYVDSQGFVHSTPEESRANEPDNWQKTTQS